MQAGEASLLQRQARLKDIEIDLANTEIRSPVDGVVVQRQIELGQTVAASLSAPTLFTIAQDLREIEIYANIDEADVGRIKPGQRVTFNVNAYPNRTFEGEVKVVRLGAQTVQNVVTYIGVISVRNDDLALLPGMTANLQVVTDQRANALRAPNAALRFRPVVAAVAGARPRRPPRTRPALRRGGRRAGRPARGAGHARAHRAGREADARAAARHRRDPGRRARGAARAAAGRERRGDPPRRAGMRRENARRIGEALDPERRARFEKLSAELAQSFRQRAGDSTPGRVYVLGPDGEPRAVEVRLGVSDGAVTEIVSGDIQAGASLIIGGGPPRAAQPAGPPSGAARPPRMF